MDNSHLTDRSYTDADTTRKTLDINYHATLRVTRAFLPLLSPTHGRVVNVASTMGGLFFYPPDLRERFLATKTEQDVSSIMDEYQAAVDAGTHKETGFAGNDSYGVSKAGLIGATRALAWEVEGLLVNACCPGYVDTEMNLGSELFFFFFLFLGGRYLSVFPFEHLFGSGDLLTGGFRGHNDARRRCGNARLSGYP